MTEDERRELILAAATEVFSEHGIAVPVSAITKRAGIGVSAFYRSFDSKQALVEELALERLSWIASIWTGALDGGDTWTDFANALMIFVHETEIHPAFLASLRAHRDDHSPRFVHALDQREAALQSVLDHAIADGTLRDDVTTEDVRAIFTAFTSANPEGGSGSRDQAYRILALLLDGLRAEAKYTPLDTAIDRLRRDPAN